MEHTPHEKSKGVRPRGTLGTFAGVFTPSVLTILGIILFLRLGCVVGNAGLGRALVIIGLANAISVLTSISLAAIATNIKVKGGGDYYLISRTLGLEFGGAIGIVLFLAQSVSIAFYCIGFGEALAAMLPEARPLEPRIIAVCAVGFLFVFAWLGADWATRFQYVVMALLTAAIFSFFAGGLGRWDGALLVRNWTGPADGIRFWVLFAIFFPAVTGFTQGVSMSGDLKDPGKSLPLGTFLAVGVSIVVYFAVAVVFAAVLPNQVSARDYGAMKDIASAGFLINAGVIAATLSSAMASFLGAPRILQSLSGDRIFPVLIPFAKGYGPLDNPRRGVLLSAGIAFVTIGFGNLNVIAPLVSMFFLISYGLLNYATFYEARSSSPSFRPRLRWFDYRISLAGCLACLGVMLAIDLRTGVVAIAILFAVFQYLKRTSGPARWADSRRSYHLQQAREHLLAAAREPEHPRDWRPHLLAFSHDTARRTQLLAFATLIQGGSGLTTVVKILVGDGVKMLRLQEEAAQELRDDLRHRGLDAFPLVTFAPSVQTGVQTLVQSFGIGPIKANTVLLNRLEPVPTGALSLKEIGYGRNLRTAFRLGLNIIVLSAAPEAWEALDEIPPKERRIDVWWSNDATGRLMLLLAYLITRNDGWDDAGIRVIAEPDDHGGGTDRDALQTMLEEVRIPAEPEVVPHADADTVIRISEKSSLVLLPFRLARNKVTCPLGFDPDEILPRLPVAALILAAEDIELDPEPDEGTAGQMAEALDALEDARKRARDAHRDARDAAEEARDAASGADEDTKPEGSAEAEKARDKAIKAARRAAKAAAKAEDAARHAEELGALPAPDEEHPEDTRDKAGPAAHNDGDTRDP